jgi:hypothetical protein
MTTDQKGAIAETAFALEAVKAGLGAFRPVAEGERYDLILDLRPELVRVQCKWGTKQGDVVSVRCYSCRRTRTGMLRRPYTAEDIDAFGVYCLELNRCFLLPIAEFRQSSVVHLRLAPARNNQQRGIVWASNYEFPGTLAGLEGP